MPLLLVTRAPKLEIDWAKFIVWGFIWYPTNWILTLETTKQLGPFDSQRVIEWPEQTTASELRFPCKLNCLAAWSIRLRPVNRRVGVALWGHFKRKKSCYLSQNKARNHTSIVSLLLAGQTVKGEAEGGSKTNPIKWLLHHLPFPLRIVLRASK